MKYTYSLILLFLASLSLQGQQEDFNIELLANVDFPEECNDIWGYVDGSGIEYAILGTQEATAIFSLEDPSNPIQRAYIPGAQSTWRDIKDFRNYLFVVADEGEDGILSIDMTQAPDNITWTFTNPISTANGNQETRLRAHNLYVDDRGYAYLSGGNVNNGGVVVYDVLSNPDTPRYVSAGPPRYSHDNYVQDNIIYSSDIGSGFFSILDANDIDDIQQLATNSTSFTFTHNAWASHDANYLFTTDERANANVDAYDISDVNDIKRIDTWKPPATVGEGVIPHNTHYQDGYIITSYYTDGIVITDVHRPDNMILTGSYDTWLGNNGGFNGCWGAYPFLPSGLLLASDIQTGLYVFQPTYSRAAYVEGIVVDSVTGAPINMAEVTFFGANTIEENTNILGEFKTGQFETGEFDISASHPEYIAKTVKTNLVSSEVDELLIELTPKPKYNITGRVIDAAEGFPLPGSIVSIQTDELEYEAITDANGEFTVVALEGEGDIFVGKWGYRHYSMENVQINMDQDLVIELDRGYMDDFVVDLGWTVIDEAETGVWERVEPNSTFAQGQASQTGDDIPDDLGDKCFVTQQGPLGGGAGTADVDDGTVTLISPQMDLTLVVDPLITYHLWFRNTGGGGGTPDDSLFVYLSNGITDTLVEMLTVEESEGQWKAESIINVPDFLEVTDSMHIRFITADQEESGHLVEAAVDQFFVEGEVLIATLDIDEKIELVVSPNPFKEHVQIRFDLEDSFTGNETLRITDLKGVQVYEKKLSQSSDVISIENNFSSGIYFVQIISDEFKSAPIKIVKQ